MEKKLPTEWFDPASEVRIDLFTHGMFDIQNCLHILIESRGRGRGAGWKVLLPVCWVIICPSIPSLKPSVQVCTRDSACWWVSAHSPSLPPTKITFFRYWNEPGELVITFASYCTGEFGKLRLPSTGSNNWCLTLLLTASPPPHKNRVKKWPNNICKYYDSDIAAENVLCILANLIINRIWGPWCKIHNIAVDWAFLNWASKLDNWAL